MTTTRRDLFKLAGGSAAGILLTPAPWRLIKDSSLWSENWPGIPQPRPGAIGFRFTHCPLCPAGCAMRARCSGAQPVALAGVAGHPLSHGALCPYGIAAHHIPYHPARLKSGAVEEALAAVSEAVGRRDAGRRVAVLDLRPGRTHSWTFRRAMAAIPGGLYLVAPGAADHTAIDLAAARTVLSFGMPLLDSWGTPGSVMAARDSFRLIQVEPVETRTAMLADLWLPIRPGTEDVLARAIATQLAGGAGTAPETGIADEQIRALAHDLVENGPSVVLSDMGWPEILALNRLIGAPGRTIVNRRETPVPESWKNAAPVTELTAIPNDSIGVLLIDESLPGDYLPWPAIEPKLASNALVVAFACSREGYGRHARFVLPAPVFPEMLDDVAAGIDSPSAAFRLTTPLIAPPAGVVSPAEFVAKLAGVDASNVLRERADSIAKARRGSVFTYGDGKTVPLRGLQPDDFWKTLNEGACWIDDRDAGAPAPSLAFRAAVAPGLVLTEERGAAPLASPLMSKLHEESHLRLAPRTVALAPGAGFVEGDRALLQTERGSMEVAVAIDDSAPPGLVQAASGPEVIDLCGGATRAQVVRI